MKKKLLLLLAVVFMFSSNMQLKAQGEGMWLPMFVKRLNYENMQEHGLKLTAEEVYSVNNSSIKDAIVSLGGFCTGEIISKEGLMLTNHHCGYDALQQFSSVENNILKNGFWAKKGEEKPVPGLTATFLIRMEDVTKEILEAIKDKEGKDKAEVLKDIKKELIEKATKGTHYTAYIKDFFYGSEFYMFVNETFEDVRLVGAPPESVGKYGGDTDNWMWPRHTGDFCMFRVFSGKDGKPAKYSKDNIPFKVRHHLPVSIKGIKEGDFSMIMGYPGSTDRYLSSFGVKQAIAKKGPTVVDVRTVKLETMKERMDKKESIDIKYSSKYAQTSNYWKYYQGQTEQLQTNNVVERKEELEGRFTKWVNQDKARIKKYGTALEDIENYYNLTNKSIVSNTYVMEAGLRGPDFVLYTFRTNRVLSALESVAKKFDAKIEKAETEEAKEELRKLKTKTRESLITQLEKSTEEHFKNYDKKTEKNLVKNLFSLYYDNVEKDMLPNFMVENGKSSFSGYTRKMFCKSPFIKESRMNDIIEDLKAGKELKDYKEDRAVVAATDLINIYFGGGETAKEEALAEEKMHEGYRLFVEGIRLMQPEKSFYPNANSTQRMTYGNVLPYKVSEKVKKILTSQDGVDTYFTTSEGLLEKESTTNPEFFIPARLKTLLLAKDFGQYADKKDGKLHICFLSQNDITGGNSGSPVINGEGHLIGTAFDGNWEAMSGDISFENSVQRTISVDIRYTLFIIDKYAGAKHLIDEMTLIK